MNDDERRDVSRRLDAARDARMERVRSGEKTELENARQVIQELRRELEAQASRVREAEACALPDGRERKALAEELEAVKQRLAEAEARSVPDEHGCQAAREEAEKMRAEIAGLKEELEKASGDVTGLTLHVEAVRAAQRADAEFLGRERDAARSSLMEGRRVMQVFIKDCAVLLGLPKLDGCSEYGGGAIRKGIERLRGALEKINEIRNDIVGRQSIGWSRHIYPLVAALNEAGFEGAPHDRAAAQIEATMEAAREIAATAWCSEKTEEEVFDPVLAEEFADILFPFLKALQFYSFLENWSIDDQPSGRSACDRDLGAHARAALGRPARDVPEIIENGDDETA